MPLRGAAIAGRRSTALIDAIGVGLEFDHRCRASHGSSQSTPIGTKSAAFRVTTVSPCTSAVAAINASCAGRGSGTCSCAHRSATALSTGRIRPANSGNGVLGNGVRFASGPDRSGERQRTISQRRRRLAAGPSVLSAIRRRAASERPHQQQHRNRHRQHHQLHRQAEPPIVAETEAAGAEDQGVVLVSDRREERA